MIYLFPIMFITVFCLVIGTFIATGVRGIRRWQRDEASPRLTVPATVVAKREHYRRNSSTHTHHTRYYVTFQFESGDRAELQTEGDRYGLLVEGDQGQLTFQGSRFLGFERIG